MALNIPTVLGTQLTGARAIFSLDGKYFAWGAGIEYSSSKQFEDYMPLSQFETQEFVPTRSSYTLSCSQFALVDRNLTTLGMNPAIGNDGQQSLINTINRGSFNATVEDVLNEKLLLQAFGLKVAGESFSISANSLVMGQVSFVCTRIKAFGQ